MQQHLLLRLLVLHGDDPTRLQFDTHVEGGVSFARYSASSVRFLRIQRVLPLVSIVEGRVSVTFEIVIVVVVILGLWKATLQILQILGPMDSLEQLHASGTGHL